LWQVAGNVPDARGRQGPGQGVRGLAVDVVVTFVVESDGVVGGCGRWVGRGEGRGGFGLVKAVVEVGAGVGVEVGLGAASYTPRHVSFVVDVHDCSGVLLRAR